MTPLCVALAVLSGADSAAAETPARGEWQWRLHANEEVAASSGGGAAQNLALAGGDLSFARGTDLKLGASLQATADGREWSGRVREAYARVSLGGGADLEAGKRLVRWGTAYAFTPTGVLDPPRDPADPTDRLHRREGMALVRADAFRGATAFTLAVAAPRLARASPAEAPDVRVAARVRGTIAGFELAAIASAAPHEGAWYGGNVTHVVGQRLEWHAEVLAHDADSSWGQWVDGTPGARTWSAAAGLQYTLPAGVNVVLEYHRDGRGLSGAQWARVLALRTGTLRPPSPPPLETPHRRQSLFARVAPISGEAHWVPELIAIVSVDDGSTTLVPGLAWNANDHVQVYGRLTRLFGPTDSVNGLAPSKTRGTAGVALRF